MKPIQTLQKILAQEENRFFLWIPPCLGLGIYAYFTLPNEPSTITTILPILITIPMLLIAKQTPLLPILIATTSIAIGFANAKRQSEAIAAPAIHKTLYNAQIKGTILKTEPAGIDRPARILIKPNSINKLPPNRIPKTIRINLSNQYETPITAGSNISVKAILFPPGRPAEPNGYNPARSAWFQQIGAFGAAKNKPAITPQPQSLAHKIDSARNALAKKVYQTIGGEAGALASALMTGKRAYVSADTTLLLRDSGLAHILAISGLHMACFAGAIFFFARAALALFPRIALSHSIKKWAVYPALAGAIFYLLFSGAGIATQRAFIMFLIACLAILMGRAVITMRNVALAAIAILMLSPEALLSPGFQMSFAATIAIVAAFEAISNRGIFQFSQDGALPLPLRRIFLAVGALFLTSVAAWAATGWFAAHHFHRVVFLTSFAANMGALPIFTVFVMPAAAFAFVLMPLGAEGLPLAVMGEALSAILWIAKNLTETLGRASALPVLPAATLPLAIFGGLWLCLWRERWRYAGCAAIAAALALAAFGREKRPDMIVSADGRNIAMRAPDGLLYAPLRSAPYAVSVWLRRDGDRRDPSEIVSRRWFRCDKIGCVSQMPHLPRVFLIKQVKGSEALCRGARVLVSRRYLKRLSCPYADLVLDRRRLAKHGAHSVWFHEAGMDAAFTPSREKERLWNRRQGSAR